MRAWIRSWLLLSMVGTAVVTGCGDDTDPDGSGAGGGSEGGAAEGGAGGEGGGAADASIRFFVDDRPHDPDNTERETDEARWGDPIRIVVEGLAPGRSVRLAFSIGSFGVFTATEDGSVDTARDMPTEGSWTTADVDGPFWSAEAGTAPVFDIDIDVTDASTDEALASASFHRVPVNVGVEITEIQEGTRVGTLARPEGGGTEQKPAILVFGGSEGGTSTGEFFAYYLAQLGYVAFGVGYFGAPGLPADLERVPLEILEDDLQFLASQPDVDPERIAVMGGSRGGELALLLGANFPELVHAVVGQIPSGLVWGATSGADVTGWTLDGVDVPFVHSTGALGETYRKDGETYYVSTPAFLGDIEGSTPEELDVATTRAENTDGPILLLAGEADNLWPSCVLSELAMDRLDASGHTEMFGDELYCFPDAGHFIAFPPGSSTLESMAFYSPEYDVWFDVGGTPEGIARAEREGNSALRAFLERAFAR